MAGAAEPSTPVGLTFYALFVALVLLLFPLHELAHFLAYRAMGVDVRMTLNTASPEDQSRRLPSAELAGPLLNLVVAVVAAFIYRRHSTSRFWAALGLAAALGRLVVYALVLGAAVITGSGLSLGNDEPTAAQLWGLPSLTLVGVLAIPFAALAWSIARRLAGTRKRAGLHLAALGLVLLGVGLLIGNVLDPWFFPRRGG